MKLNLCVEDDAAKQLGGKAGFRERIKVQGDTQR